jgi:hypothetical protein
MNITDVREILKKYKSEMSVSIFDYWIDNRMFRDDTYNSFVEFSEYDQISKEEFNNELDFIKHLVGRALVGNTFNIENSFDLMKERKYDYIILYLDVHSTTLFPDYNGMAKKYYPMAKETLQKITNDKRIKLVLYTCSYPNEIEEYVEFFKKDGIIFDGINDYFVENTRGGFFENKPYFNILFEDKGGYIGIHDWYVVDHVLDKCLGNNKHSI